MLKRIFWFCLACLTLIGGPVAEAQMAAKGIIVKVIDRLIYIDLGQDDGVQEGDLFDIVSSDVLLNPLDGDTLGVSPKNVGAIRVRRVYPKMSIAELMHIQGGEDPMLMKIARIQDAERLMEIEQYMGRGRYSGGGSSRSLALIPGLYQFKTGGRRKGLALMGLETASLVAAIAYRSSSNDWYSEYGKLSPGDDFDNYFNEASSRRTWSNRFFWLAGALYAYNLVDVILMGNGQMMAVRPEEPSPITVGMGVGRSGRTMLQLVHHF